MPSPSYYPSVAVVRIKLLLLYMKFFAFFILPTFIYIFDFIVSRGK